MQANQKCKVELDICSNQLELFHFLSQSIQKHELNITSIIFIGPAGGNPCVTFEGTYQNIYNFIKEDYFDNEEDSIENYLWLDWIKAINE